MFTRSRTAVHLRTCAVRPAEYALARGVPALADDPARRRCWLVGGGAVLAIAAAWGGFTIGRLGRTEPAALAQARRVAAADDLELVERAASVIAVAPRMPDDPAIATALDRLARRAIADRSPHGADLARRLLAALAAGARGLLPHRAELERRARRGG